MTELTGDMLRQFLEQQNQMVGSLLQHFAQSNNAGVNNVPLPLFFGKKGESVRTWLFQLEHTVHARRCSDEIKLHLVATCLKDAALQWFVNFSANNTLLSWQMFVDNVILAFEPPHYQQILRQQLLSARQTDHVQTYVQNFRGLVNQATQVAELDKVLYFSQGLKPKTRSEVLYRAPTTLEEAIDIAVKFESAHFNDYRPKYFQPKPSTAMEIDAISAPKHRAKMSVEEKKRLQSANACFYCKEAGHFANRCPKKSAKN